ncbi:HMG box protein, partial [Colletotrichum orchidophilum]
SLVIPSTPRTAIVVSNPPHDCPDSHNWPDPDLNIARTRFAPYFPFRTVSSQPTPLNIPRLTQIISSAHSSYQKFNMLTAIGRAATQRLLLRAAPLSVPRTQLFVARATACRGFSTSQWVRMPASQAATTTKTKKTTGAKKKTALKTKKPASKKPKAKKVIAKKAAPKKRVKKQLTPEETQKLKVRQWKKTALLNEPKKLPTSAWLVYVTREHQTAESGSSLTERTKALAESFKNLSSYEVQRLQETADANKLTNNAAYKSWVETIQPTDVAEANRSRARLRNASGKQVPRTIRDERQPKRPHNAYALFVKARFASGEFSGERLVDAMKAMGNEWKQLSQSEKLAYEDLAKADFDRWERESLNVLGHVARRGKSPE